jgi:DNA invertase Pin-like site-specific DNA recombinase
MLDGIRIIERVAARGATFKALDRQWLDLTTPLGKGILAFLSALAEDDRGRILARANGGRAAEHATGYGNYLLDAVARSLPLLRGDNSQLN